MHNLFILYLRCVLVCLCKDQDIKYIATKGLIIRSIVERVTSENIYSFKIQEYTRNSTKQFHFNAKTEVILLKDSTISVNQKNVCEYTAIEDVKVDATSFEINRNKLAMESRDGFFHDKINATLAIVCYYCKNFNVLEVLTAFDNIVYENKSFGTKGYKKWTLLHRY